MSSFLDPEIVDSEDENADIKVHCEDIVFNSHISLKFLFFPKQLLSTNLTPTPSPAPIAKPSEKPAQASHPLFAFRDRAKESKLRRVSKKIEADYGGHYGRSPLPALPSPALHPLLKNDIDMTTSSQPLQEL
jgi:hypothetical protein